MVIGVTGDTHNNLKNIKEICSIFNKNWAELVIHTGDISLPKSLLAFKELSCPLKVILGNNDEGEKEDLIKASNKFDCEIFEEPHFIEIGNKKFTVLHHPDLIDEEMIKNSDFI